MSNLWGQVGLGSLKIDHLDVWGIQGDPFGEMPSCQVVHGDSQIVSHTLGSRARPNRIMVRIIQGLLCPSLRRAWLCRAYFWGRPQRHWSGFSVLPGFQYSWRRREEEALLQAKGDSLYYPPIMENQMEKNMENEMETGGI